MRFGRSLFWVPWVALWAMPGGALGEAQWIWRDIDGQRAAGESLFRRQFSAGEVSASATFVVGVNHADADIYLNGERLGTLEGHRTRAVFEVGGRLEQGLNFLAVRARSTGGPSAFFVLPTDTTEQGAGRSVATDSSWRASVSLGDGWMNPGFDDSNWPGVKEYGAVRSPVWAGRGNEIGVSAFDDYEQWRQASNADESTDESAFQLLPGFEIERLRSAREDEGSWISMDFDDRGRLLIAREHRGLLRMTLPKRQGGRIQVEAINEEIPEIRGVLFAHGAIYLNSNSHNLRPRVHSGGLYRLSDRDGDDAFETVELLGERTGTGGHGRNDLVLGPDDRIYMIHGDAVAVPSSFVDWVPQPPPFLPGDDRPHGHVMRTDKDGSVFERLTMGLRNPYGIDFDRHGEMFTYDADAEFDMGAPWYRPTRLRHLLPGADYGWRRVTKEWPPYDPDHADEPPLTSDIGKGSPTAVKFGQGSHFPTPYRDALFILDWAYGRIVAVHTEPHGASYATREETFLRGRPANVTDLDFGPDGAMYFVTGGRKTQAGLYRVRWSGKNAGDRSEIPLQARLRREHADEARKIRRRLEASLVDPGSLDIDFAWEHLGSGDDVLRYSARTALEKQPLALWRERALAAKPESSEGMAALMALVRMGTTDDLIPVLQRLDPVAFAGLPESLRLEGLRIYFIARERMGGFGETASRLIGDKLAEWLPDPSPEVNQRLAELLAPLQRGGTVPALMKLVEASTTQIEEFHYLFVLREARTGWTDDLRRRYFQRLSRMSQYRGGAGLPGFIEQLQRDALDTVGGADRQRFAELIGKPAEIPRELLDLAKDRTFVKEWTLGDLAPRLDFKPGSRNLENGRRMFFAAMCGQCHSAYGEGRVLGPDLSGVGARFSRRDILDAILKPSRVVSEKYRNVTVRTRDGREVTGQLVLQGDYRKPVVRIAPNPFEPDAVIEIPKAEIASREESPISAMPEGLLDTLTAEDILDLLAWLESAGR